MRLVSFEWIVAQEVGTYSRHCLLQGEIRTFGMTDFGMLYGYKAAKTFLTMSDIGQCENMTPETDSQVTDNEDNNLSHYSTLDQGSDSISDEVNETSSHPHRACTVFDIVLIFSLGIWTFQILGLNMVISKLWYSS